MRKKMTCAKAVLPMAETLPALQLFWEHLKDPEALRRREEALRAREAALAQEKERLRQAQQAQRRCAVAGRVYLLPAGAIESDAAHAAREYGDNALIALCDSIRRIGILQPLVVRAKESGKYTLLGGERRLRAARLLGKKNVPAIVLFEKSPEGCRAVLAAALRQNTLNLFEQAASVAALCDPFGMELAGVAKALQLSEGTVLSLLRLLRFTEGEREVITAGGLTGEHCRALLRITTLEKRREALGRIVNERLTARQSALMIDFEYLSGAQLPKQKQKLLLRDAELLCTTIDRAVCACRDAGLALSVRREETPTEIRLTVHIPRSAPQPTQTVDGQKESPPLQKL